MNSNSQMDFSQLQKPFIHYSRYYFEKIKSSLITKDNLIAIYKILVKKSNEAADLQLSLSPQLPDHVKEVFKTFSGKLWVNIWGENNEYISGDHESVFDDDRLPSKIIKISFNSYFGYQMALQGNKMQNWFEIQFDFKKNKILDFSKITDLDNHDNSYFKVEGTKDTWVDGVYQAINIFLIDKSKNRNWLYSGYIYDVLLWLIFIPIVFRIAYKFDSVLSFSKSTSPLSVAFNIYIFIISLFAFRIIFNYARWIFPLVELKNGNRALHRGALVTIILAIISTPTYELIRGLVLSIF